MRTFLFFIMILFWGCQSKNEAVEKDKVKQGRENKEYVWALMTQYSLLDELSDELEPPPPIGRSFFTIGAIHKGDTMRILLNTIIELAELSLIANSPIDSFSLASLVKGDILLELNEAAKETASIIRPWPMITSVTSQGKGYTLNYFFDERGRQKIQLDPPQQTHLIDALSNWGLLVYFNCYRGIYGVREVQNAKLKL